MEFGNGIGLAGLALGAIPIIIHLINRQRAKLKRFAAIDFLLLSDKRLARRLKLKQLLVLALRAALLMFFAFALAKPYIEPDLVATRDASEPGGVALVIDDSTSMQTLAPDGRTLLDHALEQARDLVASGGSRTSFAVIAAGRPARLLTKGLSYDKEAVGRALDRLASDASRPRSGDLAAALTEAGRTLSESPEPRRQVYVIGDQAAHAWRFGTPSWNYVPITDVEVIDVRGGQPIDNLAVTGVAVTKSGPVSEPVLEVEVALVNHGVAPRTAQVTLELGDKVVADTATVPAGEPSTVTFKVRAPPDVTGGTVRLVPDALPLDDSWVFTLGQTHAINVLVVNGAPRSVPWQDELYFLRAALRARQTGDVALNPLFATSAELKPGQINAADVVVLANVGTLTAEQQLALHNFVEKGGGLLVTGGDSFGEDANKSYGDLLPYPIRATKTVAKAGDPAAALSALTLATASFDHPVMQVFDGVEDASLFKAHVYSYLLLDTASRPGSRVIASYTGGIPALAEGVVGRGRTMLLTTTLDMDWSDLAIRSSFLPLVQRACQYLGRALDRPGGPGHLVGEGLHVPLPDGGGPLVLVQPDGTEIPREETADDIAAGSLYVEAPDQVGLYLLMRAGDRRHAVRFAVNADRVESDLTPVTAETERAVIAEMTRNNGIVPDAGVAEPAMIAAAAGGEARSTILWPYILAGLFLLFGAEAWLVVRS
ncbi:MAG: hypothetical protein EP329_13985 [Deltaproteobacteria bacterium]|nr:MAG: hypothetical protein EP329_13985 [Deltaproteobacteria bacterium]